MVHHFGNRQRRVGALIAGLVSLLLVAGCSSSGGAPTTESSSSPPPDLTRVPVVSWQPYQSVMLPFSGHDGPAITYEIAPHGYAHNPQGALLAGLNAEARLSLAPDQSWPTVVNTLIAPGAGRDRFAAARAAVTITAAPTPGQAPAYAGYRWVGYNDGEATIDVAVTQNNQLSSKQLVLRWVRGYNDNPDDWKLLLPVDGIGHTPTPITSLDGFTAFGSQP